MSRAALAAALDELRAAYRQRRDWLGRVARPRLDQLPALAAEGERIAADIEAAGMRVDAAVAAWHLGEEHFDDADALRLSAELDQLAALILER